MGFEFSEGADPAWVAATTFLSVVASLSARLFLQFYQPAPNYLRPARRLKVSDCAARAPNADQIHSAHSEAEVSAILSWFDKYRRPAGS